VFEPEATMKGKVKVSKTPVTYWNRIRLKRSLKNMADAWISRERTLPFVSEREKSRMIKFIFFLHFNP